MEYVFGNDSDSLVENLKTVGPEHTDLKGFCEVIREYPDCTITDSFAVVRKTQSDEDAEGNCYDWYEISHHNRTIDKTKTMQSSLEALIVSALEG